MTSRTRAQSEVIGVALLVGVVVTVVGIASVTIFAGVDTTERPAVDLRLDANDTHVTVTHAGGGAVPLADLRIVLDGDSRTRFTPDPANVAGSSGEFGLGDRLIRSHGIGGSTMDILVVHAPSNTVLAEERIDIRSASGSKPQVEFSVSPSSPNAGQDVTFDGSATTDPDGDSMSYAWDFDGDGNDDATGETVTHSYASTGTYTVTLDVVDETGQRSSASKTVTVGDGSVPSISAFTVTNPSGQDVQVSFDSDEQLAGISVSISNAESATLTGSDFIETASGGTYTYEATYTGSSDGTYDATLNSATDSAGNDGASGQSDSVTVDTTSPSITGTSILDATDGNGVVNSGDSVTVSATVSDATSGVDTVTADASAFDAGTVTLTDGDGDGTYDRTFGVGTNPTDGDQPITITATDNAGNSATATTSPLEIDTTAPTISAFSIVNSAGQNVRVSFESDEPLSQITVEITNAESATLTESDFTVSESGGTYTYEATYDGSRDGVYDATLITAEDEAGNDGASGQSGSTTVDTVPPNVQTFSVEDTSYCAFRFFGFCLDANTRYQVQWSVSDATSSVDTTTVELIWTGDGSVDDSTSGSSGDQALETTFYSTTPFRIRLTSTDTDGNEVCREITDVADGSGSYTKADATSC